MKKKIEQKEAKNYFSYVIIIFLFCFYISLVSGCVRQQLVKVPVKCEIQKQEKIFYNEHLSNFENIKKILQYVEILERDLNFCIDGEK